IAGPRWRAEALARLALAAAEQQPRKHAKGYAAQAEALIDDIPEVGTRVRLLTLLVRAMRADGRNKRADRLLTRVEPLLAAVPDPAQRDRADRLLADGPAGTGATADGAAPVDRIRALVEQIRHAADRADAARLTADATARAHDLDGPFAQARTLAGVAEAAAVRGLEISGLLRA